MKRKKITLPTRSMIDREIGESLEDFRKGRVYGPFDSAEEMIAALRREVRNLRKAKKPRRSGRQDREEV